MSLRLVVDASIAISWVHPAQATAETAGVLTELADGGRLVVPALWPIEVANALLVLERRKRLRSEERLGAMRFLEDLAPIIDDEGSRRAFGRISELATIHALTISGAVYLELAIRRRLPLATKDESLRFAAQEAGAQLR